MALILADTDVLIDYLDRRQPAAGAVLGYLQRDELQTTAINCFELLSGARPETRGDAVRASVQDLDIVALDRAAAGARGSSSATTGTTRTAHRHGG